MAVQPASRSSRSVLQPTVPVPVPQTAGPPAEGRSRPLLSGSVTIHPGNDGLGKEAPGGSPYPAGAGVAWTGSQWRPGRGQVTEAGFWEGPAGGLCFHL